MFQGFNESTIEYYKAVRKNNCKHVHKEKEALYLEGVKNPLEELYIELYHYFSKVDGDLLHNKRRCISSAYNDARFCRSAPIKEYFYLRFQLDKVSKKNIPGFFFDASLNGYKYGLNIYHPSAGGMESIRNYILENRRCAKRIIGRFHKAGLLEVRGEKYKKSHYPEEETILLEWVERKNISFIHEENLNPIFYERELLNRILTAFDSARDVYFMLKEAL